MEYGRYKHDEGMAVYSSNVSDDSPETHDAFRARVSQWAARCNITLGEGRIVTYDDLIHPGDKTLYMFAPLIQGDPADALFVGYLDTDASVKIAEDIE